MSGRRSSSSEGRPGGDVDGDLLRVERQRRRQVRRQPLADEQPERVLVERSLAQRLGQRGLGAFELRLGLAIVELRARAVVEAQLGEPGRVFARRQRVARDAQLLVVGDERQIAVGDRCDEADLHRLARLGGREVLRQRGVAQVMDAAEQVELVAGDGEADGVDVGDCRCRSAALEAGRTDADRRQLVGAANLIERSRLLDVEDGDAQVAVVGEGERRSAASGRGSAKKRCQSRSAAGLGARHGCAGMTSAG